MRKTMIAIAGAAALALCSGASAAVTVTGSSGLNNPDPTAAGSIQTVGNVTTINFGQNPVSSPNFTASFSFTNTVAGLYSIISGTSAPNVFFTSGTLTGPGACTAGCGLAVSAGGKVLSLGPVSLGAGNFTYSTAGTNTAVGGSFTGNLTISQAVPEPGTWGMMLLGFGAMGLVIRSRRRPALAQLA